MNLLNIYLLKEKITNDSKEEGTVNFNRLIQKLPVTIKDFQELAKKTKNKKNILHKQYQKYFIEHKYKSAKDDNKSFENKMKKNNLKGKKYLWKESISSEYSLNVNLVISLENACIQNLFDSRLEKQIDVKMFYNLNKLMNDNDLTPYVCDIKKFLKTIVDKKVYQQAIKKLFPNDYNSLISNNNEEIKQYIDERIKFCPFQDLDLSGITDKLSCYSFIPSIIINYSIISN